MCTWRAQIQQWKAAKPFSYKDSETVLKPQWVIELLDKTRAFHILIQQFQYCLHVAYDWNIRGNIFSDFSRIDINVQQWKAAKPFSYKDSETVLKPQWVIELLDKTTKGYQSVGIGHLSADGRRETKSHRTQSTGGDP
jgi:Uma2 family endonuclease